MKKILQSLAAFTAICTVANNASAQLPDYGVFPSGVTVTDINGTVHDFDAILNSGKTIVLDAFADWCGPCWTYHQGHTLEDLWVQRGPSGSDDVLVIAIEADPAQPESTISDAGSGQGDWTQGVTYPQANDDNIADIINLAYYPTIIMICPDRTTTEVGQTTLANFNTAINGCAPVPTISNDPRIIGQNSDEVFCSGDNATMRAVVQNYGSATLTSATIEVFDGATSVASMNWTGSLDQFEAEEVTIGTVTPSAATTYAIRVTSANDDVNNDEINASVAPAQILDINSTDQVMGLEVSCDGYASEFGLILQEGAVPNSSLPAVYQAAAANPSSVAGFMAINTQTDGTASFGAIYPITTQGCYTLTLVDNYGDGIIYQNPGGQVKLIGAGADEIIIPGDYGSGVQTFFEANYVATASIDENEAVTNMNIFPNPTNGITNIVFDADNVNTTVEVMNIAGQVVYTSNLGVVSGAQKVTVDAANFEAGIYLVNIITENGVATARISVSK